MRAVMEGVTYSLNDCLGVLAGMGVAPETMLACGGGGKSPVWRQMLADVMKCPVATTVNTEGPALGVAILAGVGAGLYGSVQEACRAPLRRTFRSTRRFTRFIRRYIRRTRNCLRNLGRLSDLWIVDSV